MYCKTKTFRGELTVTVFTFNRLLTIDICHGTRKEGLIFNILLSLWINVDSLAPPPPPSLTGEYQAEVSLCKLNNLLKALHMQIPKDCP